MKSFKRFLLNEASTTKAQAAEATIVYNYNRFYSGKERTPAQARKIGGISQKEWEKAKSHDLVKSQKKTAESLSKIISVSSLQMSKKGGTNFYKDARDNTPKTDIMSGDATTELISLKMSGDKGEGAQLISSKSAEAAGCVKAGVSHWEQVGGKKITEMDGFKRSMEILETEMKSEKWMSNSIIRAGEAKDDVGEWYLKLSGRFGELMKANLKSLEKYEVGKKEELIIKHMRAELMRFKVIAQKGHWEKWFIDEIPSSPEGAQKNWVGQLVQPSYGTFEKYILPAYVETETGLSTPEKDTPISPGSKINWTRHNLGPGVDEKRIKNEVKNIVITSMKTVGWKEELESFFSNLDGLPKWVVYEAASGFSKFTDGEKTKFSQALAMKPPTYQIANKLMVFHETGGVKKWYDSVLNFADTHTNLLKNLDISFKSSDKGKYIKFGISTDSFEPPIDKTINECIDAEWSTLNEDIEQIYSDYLTEGFFGDIGKKLKGAGQAVVAVASKIKDKLEQVVKAFYNRVILRFVSKLWEWAGRGINFFLEMAGFEMQAAMVMASPSW